MIRTRLAYLAAAVGVYAGVSCSLVGVFPMDNLATHVMVARSFFYSDLVAVALYTLAIRLDKRRLLSRWLILPGAITVASFAAFVALLLIPGLGGPQALDPRQIERPAFWLTTILEWSVFITVLIWVIWVSIYLATRKPARSPA